MTKAADRTESNVLGGDLCLGFTFSSWSQSWSHVYCWPSEFLVSNSSIPSSGTKSWSNGPGQTCIPCLNGSQSWGRRELEEEGKVSQSYSLRFLICITWAVLKKNFQIYVIFLPFLYSPMVTCPFSDDPFKGMGISCKSILFLYSSSGKSWFKLQDNWCVQVSWG